MVRYSIKDIARLSNTSISTVSRTINGSGYVSAEKRQRIQKVIDEIGFRPNAAAQSLVRHKSGTIGLCIPFLDNPLVSELMMGVESRTREHGLDVFLCHTKEDEEIERKSLERLIDRQVEGIIIAPVNCKSSNLQTVISNNIPVVCTIRRSDDLDVPSVLVDDVRCARRCMQFLLDRGHRRIAVIKGSNIVSSAYSRWQAVQEVLMEYGLFLPPDYVWQGNLSLNSCYEVARTILSLENRPTAIFCTHYWATASVVRVANEMGISIPNELSLISFESFENWSTYMPVQTTANDYPGFELGRTATDMLSNLIAGEENAQKHVLLDMEFVDRGSVRAL